MSYLNPLASTSQFGSMKVGIGLTATNGTVAATLGLLNYGFFEDGTQTNPVANAVNIVTLSTTGPTNGMAITGGNAVTIDNAGVYTILFTTNISKTSGGTDTISMWLRLNTTDVSSSRQDLTLTGTSSKIFTSGNYTLSVPANGVVQMCWSSADTTMSLSSLPAAITPVRPTGAGVKLTLTRIS